VIRLEAHLFENLDDPEILRRTGSLGYRSRAIDHLQ
jgi:hypothetical protein